VHAWVVQRVRDVPYAGQVEVLVRKPRLVCAEPACPRRTLASLAFSGHLILWYFRLLFGW
jgi:hypothetical protein